jgi:hypothetical protein
MAVAVAGSRQFGKGESTITARLPIMVPPEAMLASVKKDVEMLRRLQNADGGWAFWKHGDESWPFLTAHVAHALARAREKGFDVPAQTLDAARPYLEDVERHLPSFYSKEARQALIAYSLYVRARLGDRDVAKAQRLISDGGGVEGLPLEAVAWIYPVVSGASGAEQIVTAIRKLIGNRVEETAGAAHFTSSYAGGGSYLLLHSDRRIDALFLEGLIADQPRSDLTPKLVEGLLGPWSGRASTSTRTWRAPRRRGRSSSRRRRPRRCTTRRHSAAAAATRWSSSSETDLERPCSGEDVEPLLLPCRSRDMLPVQAEGEGSKMDTLPCSCAARLRERFDGLLAARVAGLAVPSRRRAARRRTRTQERAFPAVAGQRRSAGRWSARGRGRRGRPPRWRAPRAAAG